MVPTPLYEHTVLESGETTVVVEYGADGHARLAVTSVSYRRGSAEAGRLACEAVHQARLRHAEHVEGALDASSPACGAILEALHRRIGSDVQSIAMRRAGSSVLVTLEMQPAPATPTPTPVTPSLAPAAPSNRHRPLAVGMPAYV
jgi:hypothetical protein